MQGAGGLAQTLVSLPGRGLGTFVADVKRSLIAAQLLLIFLIGFLFAGAFGSYFYFEAQTLDRAVACLYVAGEFLLLMLLTAIVYFIRKGSRA